MVPPLTDFQTPPLAEPTNTVRRPLSLTAVDGGDAAAHRRRADVARREAGDRSGIVADRRLSGERAASEEDRGKKRAGRHVSGLLSAGSGIWKCRLSRGTLTSIRSTVILVVSPGFCLLPRFERERIVNAADQLVRAGLAKVLAHGAANETHVLDADFEIGFGIQVIIGDVAVLESDFELVGVVALDGVVAEVFDLVALRLIVDQRAVEIAVLHQCAQLVLAEQLGIFAALEGRDLPADRAVVGVDLGHALDGEGLADHVGRHRRRGRPAAEKLPCCIRPVMR